ncbi:MAG: hypothetical protein KDK10_17710 [Maritimibacter sp.]|nr:hypothetical protein [Maritimibacter sp.]
MSEPILGQGIARFGPFILAGVVFNLSLALNIFAFGSGFGTPEALAGMFDARHFTETGSALLSGTAPPQGRVSFSGYLYPVVAAAFAALSPLVLIVVQTAAVAFGAWFLASTEQRLTGRMRFSPLAAFSVSLLLAPGQMMSEAFAFFTLSAAVRALIERDRAPVGVGLLAVAALLKPALIPVLVLSLPALFPIRRASLAVAGFALALFASQLAVSYAVDGAARLSTAGGLFFSDRFYPAVYGEAEGLGFTAYNSPAADAARAERPEPRAQAGYLLAHPGPAFRAWEHILWERHLTETTGFAPRSHASMRPEAAELFRRASAALNRVFLATGLLGLIGSLVFVARTGWRHWPAALVAPALLATAPLVYWQGDRIVTLPLLVLLPFAGLALARLPGFAPRPPEVGYSAAT